VLNKHTGAMTVTPRRAIHRYNGVEVAMLDGKNKLGRGKNETNMLAVLIDLELQLRR
jgi:hypothetical protein